MVELGQYALSQTSVAVKEVHPVPSLLFVHNPSDDRSMYAEYLRGEGFEVREVGTTDEALTLTSGVDLVITGLMVRGDLNPLDFIRRARSESGRPIIVVTANVYPDSVTKAYDAGAHVVLVKPCLPDVLLHEVQRLIESPQVRLVAPQPRRTVEDRRSDLRGGRRHGEWFHRES